MLLGIRAGGVRQRGVVGGAVAVVAAMALAGCGGGSPVDAKPVGGVSTPTATGSVTATPSPSETASVAAAGAVGAVDDTASVMSVRPVVVDVLANDTFKAAGGAAEAFREVVRKGKFTLAVEVAPTTGTAVVGAGGSSFTYTPQVGFGGEDEFTYKVTVDGQGGAEDVSGTAVVRLRVSAPKPAPVKTPAKPKKPPVKVSYKNCSAARAAGAAPIREGQAGYGPHLDRDGDGVGCEANEGRAGSGGGSGAGGGGGAGGGSASGGSGSGGGGSVSYKNCSAVRAAGAAPIRRGDPGYGRHLDRDGDGVACE